MTKTNPNHPRTLKPRKRYQLDCSSPVLTDQSLKGACDINNIMAQYAKTGLFTHVAKGDPQFLDHTVIPDLATAHKILNDAMDAFESLPPEVRRLMDNDYTQLESFVSDDENKEILEKHGLRIKQAAPIKVETSGTPKSDPPPVG